MPDGSDIVFRGAADTGLGDPPFTATGKLNDFFKRRGTATLDAAGQVAIALAAGTAANSLVLFGGKTAGAGRLRGNVAADVLTVISDNGADDAGFQFWYLVLAP